MARVRGSCCLAVLLLVSSCCLVASTAGPVSPTNSNQVNNRLVGEGSAPSHHGKGLDSDGFQHALDSYTSRAMKKATSHVPASGDKVMMDNNNGILKQEIERPRTQQDEEDIQRQLNDDTRDDYDPPQPSPLNGLNNFVHKTMNNAIRKMGVNPNNFHPHGESILMNNLNKIRNADIDVPDKPKHKSLSPPMKVRPPLPPPAPAAVAPSIQAPEPSVTAPKPSSAPPPVQVAQPAPQREPPTPLQSAAQNPVKQVIQKRDTPQNGIDLDKSTLFCIDGTAVRWKKEKGVHPDAAKKRVWCPYNEGVCCETGGHCCDAGYDCVCKDDVPTCIRNSPAPAAPQPVAPSAPEPQKVDLEALRLKNEQMAEESSKRTEATQKQTVREANEKTEQSEKRTAAEVARQKQLAEESTKQAEKLAAAAKAEGEQRSKEAQQKAAAAKADKEKEQADKKKEEEYQKKLVEEKQKDQQVLEREQEQKQKAAAAAASQKADEEAKKKAAAESSAPKMDADVAALLKKFRTANVKGSDEFRPETGLKLWDGPDLPVGDGYTWMMWMKIEAKSDIWTGVIQKGSDVQMRAPAIWVIPGTTELHVRSASQLGWNTGVNAEAVPLNKWTHVAVTHNQQTMRVFYNGIESINRDLPKPNFNTAPMWACGPWYNPAKMWLAEVRYSMEVLAAADILRIVVATRRS